MPPKPIGTSSTATHGGTRVRAARQRRGWSLRGMASELGISPATLSQIETGKVRLDLARLSGIANLLDMTVEDVLTTPVTDHGEPLEPRPHARPADHQWRAYPPLKWDPVLTAALAEFVHAGYHGASVRDIARRCGLSVSGLYHYYPSKQAMLRELLNRTMTDLLRRCTAARDEGTGPVERFSLLVESLALWHTHRRELGFLGASEMRSLEPDNRKRIAAMRNAQQRMVDAEVDAATADGSFRTRRPHEASRAVVTMCTALPQWYRPGGRLSPEQIAHQYVEFALDMMRHQALDPRTSS